MKKLFPVLLTCLSFSLAVAPSRADDEGKDKEKAESTSAAGRTLAEYKLGETVANDAVTMDSLKGKVVILEMWGVNCGPCLAAMPNLEKLYDRNKKKGLAVIGIHCQSATDDEVKEKVKKLKVSFPITKNGGGPREGNGIPHSLVFDSTGKMVFEGHPANADFDKAVRKAMKGATATAEAGESSSGLAPKPSSLATKAAVLVPERSWTNSSGKAMVAALISVDGDTAKFKKKDGSVFTYAVSKLNEDDQATIKEAVEKTKEGATTP